MLLHIHATFVGNILVSYKWTVLVSLNCCMTHAENWCSLPNWNVACMWTSLNSWHLLLNIPYFRCKEYSCWLIDFNLVEFISLLYIMPRKNLDSWDKHFDFAHVASLTFWMSRHSRHKGRTICYREAGIGCNWIG